MTLIADMWRNMLWCGMIGTGLGLLFAIIGVFRSGPTPGSSAGFDIGGGGLAGAVVAMILLGLPACAWSFGRWLLVKPHAVAVTAAGGATPATGLAHEASNGAMRGSAAAIPGAFAGGVAGILLVVGFLSVVIFISLLTGTSWWTDVVNFGLLKLLIGFTVGGALLGGLAGMVLGGTLGAIFTSLRAVGRTHS